MLSPQSCDCGGHVQVPNILKLRLNLEASHEVRRSRSVYPFENDLLESSCRTCTSHSGIASSPSVFGQGIVTGMISGTVMDAQGAVVAGATVQSTHVATAAKFSDKSDSLGYYEL